MEVEVVVKIMGGERDNKPIFHDFFASTSNDVGAVPGELMLGKGGAGGESKCEVVERSVSASTLVSTGLSSDSSRRASEIGSERRGVNNSEVFHFNGRKSDVSGPELHNSLPGRKRSFYDSVVAGLVVDRHLPAGSDSFERSSIFKIMNKDVVAEGIARSQGDGIMIPVQPPRWPNPMHMASSSRPDSLVSTHALSSRTGQILYRPSRFCQGSVHSKKVSSSNNCRDANAMATIISPSTADEGSRTGIKGYGSNKIINPSGEAGQQNLVGLLPRRKISGDTQPGTCSAPRCHATTSATRQMTIFYGGQAHVFDDVHPNKADVIMALASSGGGSWTTTYGNKLTYPPAKGKSNVHTQVEIPDNKKISGFSQLAQKQPANDNPSLQTDGEQGSLTDRDQMLVAQATEPNAEGKKERSNI